MQSSLVETTYTCVLSAKQAATTYVPSLAMVILANEMNTWTEATSQLVNIFLISTTALLLNTESHCSNHTFMKYTDSTYEHSIKVRTAFTCAVLHIPPLKQVVLQEDSKCNIIISPIKSQILYMILTLPFTHTASSITTMNSLHIGN